jgi:hypothetical protein
MSRITLSKGRSTQVDDVDYEWLIERKWQSLETKGLYYAITQKSDGGVILMHRLIMNPPSSHVVHHIDGNGENNHRYNLAVLTYSQHTATAKFSSKSPFRGVRFHFTNYRWEAYIKYQGVNMSLGYFDTALGAALERDRVALKLFGEHVYLNFNQIFSNEENE